MRFAVFALLSFSACKGDYSGLTGEWNTDWGNVVIKERSGTYSDTYGTGPGTMEFTKVGDGAFTATWGESPQRHGTMKVRLSADGRTLTGTWTPDDDVRIGSTTGGTIRWTKK